MNNTFFSNRPIFKTALFALFLFPFLILINGYSPHADKAAEGYNSVIIGYEMVSDEAELIEVLTPLDESEVENIDKLNYIDFGFMLTYGAFLFLMMGRIGEVLRVPFLLKARWLAVVIVLADIIENVQLLRLSHFIIESGIEVGSAITILIASTWIKWILLALAFALIGYSFIKLRFGYKVLGFLISIPLFLGIGAFITGQNEMEDLFATSIFGCFFIVFLFGLLYKNDKIGESSNV